MEKPREIKRFFVLERNKLERFRLTRNENEVHLFIDASSNQKKVKAPPNWAFYSLGGYFNIRLLETVEKPQLAIGGFSFQTRLGRSWPKRCQI